MQIDITLTKRHFYVMLIFIVLITTTMLTYAYGTNNPVVFGHSAGELVVNGTSIVTGSINASHIQNNSLTENSINLSALTGTVLGLFAGGLNCTDCINYLEIDGTTLSLSCTTTSTSTSGSNTLTISKAVTAGYALTGGGCVLGGSGLDRWLRESKPSGSSWQCISDDGAGSVSSSLTVYVTGCKLV